MEYAGPPPEAMVKIQFMLLRRAMSVSTARQQQKLVLMSVAHRTIRDHVDVPDQGSHLEPLGYPRAVQHLGDQALHLTWAALWRGIMGKITQTFVCHEADTKGMFSCPPLPLTTCSR